MLTPLYFLAPLSLVRGGYYTNGSLVHQASYSYYRSRYLINATNSYDLLSRAGNVNLYDSSPHGDGFSLRCVGR